ncbi:putative P450 monooxygenase [Polyplosphaeria fusca]|uniref:P450 monooxygenase n=1 Tax=Polyplosphaeria fusca TaxID=682080 RepID=A0A9P4QUT4_9PLEO|nr:putative P450 monooxygenase [Polyplosphaeria fusca]
MQLHYLPLSIAAVLVLCALYTILRAALSPLRHIPGPFLARFTRAWYFHSIWKGKHDLDISALHRAYAKPGQYFAPIIRIAPNMYSISAPEKAVYGVSSKMPKSSWYEGWQHPSPDHWTVFTDRNIQRHAESRRVYGNLYAMSSVVSYEKYVDDCTEIFESRLREIAHQGQAVDMGHWIQCWAFDVIGDITYGKRFGFLDKGEDVAYTMRGIYRRAIYSTLVGVYAWAHPYVYPIMERIPSSGPVAYKYLIGFASSVLRERKMERAAREAQGKPAAEEKGDGEAEDFIDKMLDMQRDQKKGITDYHVIALGMSNMIAGSDTTAGSFSSTLFQLTRSPRALATLRSEISRVCEETGAEDGKLSYRVSEKMPYLQACIKEGMRLFPIAGLSLFRDVGARGADLCGEHFPAGSEVGINLRIAHFNEDVWGLDAAEFRPERWLESDGERLKLMNTYFMPFGLGSRTCIGKNISLLEMSKLLPPIVMGFDLEIMHSDRWLDTKNFWFMKAMNFDVRVRARRGNI